MILECPSCDTRYLVQIGLFAQGGRHVRCALCKHEWHAILPTSIDVFEAPADFSVEAIPPVTDFPMPPVSASSDFSFAPSRPPPSFHSSFSGTPPVGQAVTEDGEPIRSHLPAVIKKWNLRKRFLQLLVFLVVVGALVGFFVVARKPIVKIFPKLRDSYQSFELEVPPDWDGLFFDKVTSELRYDSGTMKLFVDGTIRNTAKEVLIVPDIQVRALGPDKRVVLSWWVEAPVATLVAGGEVPFHTEIATPMERTIEDVHLDFYIRDEKPHANK